MNVKFLWNGIKGLDRTYEELKHANAFDGLEKALSLDRTYEELKHLIHRAKPLRHVQRLDPTYEELKQRR